MEIHATQFVGAAFPVILQEKVTAFPSGQLLGRDSYLYGLDLVSMADNSGVQTYFLQDGLGSTTGLTDGDGSMTATYQYDAFGAVKTKTGTGDTAYRFTGELQDAESGMYYLRARYYDPALGRFLGRDPFAGSDTVPQTKNRYAYAYNNPANLVDPLGLCGLKGAGDVADCAAKIAEGFAYGINKLEKAIDLCAELGPSKCPADLAANLQEALSRTLQDAAEWLGEDYHWLTLVEVGAAAAFGAGLPMVLAENATLSELLVGTALISGGLGVGVSAYTFDVAGLKARAVKQGNMWALAEGAVTLGTAPFSFMGGETGWLIGTGGMAFDYLDEFWGDSGARSGPKE